MIEIDGERESRGSMLSALLDDDNDDNGIPNNDDNGIPNNDDNGILNNDDNGISNNDDNGIPNNSWKHWNFPVFLCKDWSIRMYSLPYRYNL